MDVYNINNSDQGYIDWTGLGLVRRERTPSEEVERGFNQPGI